MKLPKKYQHMEIEESMRNLWEQNNIYRFDETSSRPCYSIDTPPPYVSADHLHMGHAMSYTQAEFIVRFKRMMGFNVYYPMGFDDNGLPTERYVENKYNIDKKTINRHDFIDLCLRETRKGIKNYKTLWNKLGISVDWKETYSTINRYCQKTAQLSFLDLCNKGYIKRCEEPILWCNTCLTSIAQADIETQEQTSYLWTIKFIAKDHTKVLISTTRPELLPACVSLYAHPDDTRYKELIGKEFIVPLFNYSVSLRTHADVDPLFGTGLMMVCTWGDHDDIVKWKEDSLETRIIFHEDGILNSKAGRFEGLSILEARHAICDELHAQRYITNMQPITHKVQIHERCNTPVEFRNVPQWFIKILDSKQHLLLLGDELKWYPEFMKRRYIDWVHGLKWDWCISRQRFYGVPFPVWYCKACHEPWQAPIEMIPVDPTETDCPGQCQCGSSEFLPETDVMDTWMTSSLTPFIISGWAENATHRMNLLYPNTIRVQAFEIIRTWLFYTMVKGLYHTQSLPWRQVMISGWGLDSKGDKISKRKGNYQNPLDIIAHYSADAVRYWSASASLGRDLRFSEEKIQAGQRLCIKLWHASRFLSEYIQGNTDQTISKDTLTTADSWIIYQYNDTVLQATDLLDNYNYNKAIQTIEDFFFNGFCDNYLEIIKPRLWKKSTCTELEKEFTISLCALLLEGILRLFAPYLPFITDYIYQKLFSSQESQYKSIHQSTWPEPLKIEIKYVQSSELLLQLITAVRGWKSTHKVHTNHRITELGIQCNSEEKDSIRSFEDDLKAGARANLITFIEQGDFKLSFGSIAISIMLE